MIGEGRMKETEAGAKAIIEAIYAVDARFVTEELAYGERKHPKDLSFFSRSDGYGFLRCLYLTVGGVLCRWSLLAKSQGTGWSIEIERGENSASVDTENVTLEVKSDTMDVLGLKPKIEEMLDDLFTR